MPSKFGICVKLGECRKIQAIRAAFRKDLDSQVFAVIRPPCTVTSLALFRNFAKLLVFFAGQHPIAVVIKGIEDLFDNFRAGLARVGAARRLQLQRARARMFTPGAFRRSPRMFLE